MEQDGRPLGVAQPQPTSGQSIVPPAEPPEPGKSRAKLVGVVAAVVIIVVLAGGYWLFVRGNGQQPQASTSPPPPVSQNQTPAANPNLPGLQLDANKNYGNKYADGILPVGDSKYSTKGPAVGTPYVCQNYATNLAADAGGAMVRGPWFIGTTEYNVNKKLHVQGSVTWQASFSNTLSGSTRTIVTNDLPDHTTGVFPISPTDPAYAYDRNPNHILGQKFTYSLSADPTYSATPNCIGGEVGIMLTGVALFSAFDAGGRDAGAWEVQDSCNGHPQMDSIYHYHTLSSCIKNTTVKTVIGFALDGFPITGPQISPNNILTTDDLDECHGITSQIVLDGKTVTMYHYAMTQDFPYSVSCYRGTPIQPPGQAVRGNQP